MTRQQGFFPKKGKDPRDLEAGASFHLETPMSTTTPPSTIQQQIDAALYPDGGYQAWSSVVGCFIVSFTSLGYVNSSAVFQTYYSTVTLPDVSQSTLSWIGSVQLWGCFFFGILSGWLSDAYGPRVPIGLGGFFIVIGTMMTSVSTKYYQFMLSQGVCSAIGFGLSFTPSLSIPSQWFLKKRGLVVGIVMAGQNLGGTSSLTTQIKK